MILTINMAPKIAKMSKTRVSSFFIGNRFFKVCGHMHFKQHLYCTSSKCVHDAFPITCLGMIIANILNGPSWIVAITSDLLDRRSFGLFCIFYGLFGFFMFISVRCAQNPPPCLFFANLAAEHSYFHVFSSQSVKKRCKQ